MRKIENTDIEKNIEFFLKWGNYTKILSFVLAGILAVMALGALSGEYFDEEFGFLLIPAALLAVYALVFEQMLKWKAYMLYTNYKK